MSIKIAQFKNSEQVSQVDESAEFRWNASVQLRLGQMSIIISVDSVQANTEQSIQLLQVDEVAELCGNAAGQKWVPGQLPAQG